jgi:hypothetical protein
MGDTKDPYNPQDILTSFNFATVHDIESYNGDKKDLTYVLVVL